MNRSWTVRLILLTVGVVVTGILFYASGTSRPTSTRGKGNVAGWNERVRESAAALARDSRAPNGNARQAQGEAPHELAARMLNQISEKTSLEEMVEALEALRRAILRAAPGQEMPVAELAAAATSQEQDVAKRTFAMFALGLMKRNPAAGLHLQAFITAVDDKCPKLERRMMVIAAFALALRDPADIDAKTLGILLTSGRACGIFAGSEGSSANPLRPATANPMMLDITCFVGRLNCPAISDHVRMLLGSAASREAALQILPLLESSNALIESARELTLSDHVDPEQRRELVQFLLCEGNPNRSADALTLVAKTTDEHTLNMILAAMNGDDRSLLVNTLRHRLASSSLDESSRTSVVQAIAKSGTEDAIPLLAALSRGDDAAVRMAAVRELSGLLDSESFLKVAQDAARELTETDPSIGPFLSMLSRQAGGNGQLALKSIAATHPREPVRLRAARILNGEE